MAAFKMRLKETLSDLSDEELEKFKEVLEWIANKRGHPDVSRKLRGKADRADIVDVMVENYGQQSLEMIKKVLLKMNRTDLVQRMSETSSDHGRSKPSRSSMSLDNVFLRCCGPSTITSVLSEFNSGKLLVNLVFMSLRHV